MLVPVSWLREHVDVPAGATGRDLAERLIRAGMEVEQVEVLGAEVVGPLVVGRVVGFEQFTASNGKTIRYCQVEVGADHGGVRGIVCGAQNFAANDLVIVALPGAVLPGGFAIAARKTYGHLSDGMICSVRELGIGDDHAGILVLGPGRTPGDDVLVDLQMRDDVLDVAITPDRGYCMSVRGLARELATAYDATFRDPGALEGTAALDDVGPGYPIELDTDGCDRFVAVTLSGLDPHASSPLWMRARLQRSGVRPISLAVDVTNYVQLELGQPLHAYDAELLAGPIRVRTAHTGEQARTLDGTVRKLLDHDVVITDSGAAGSGSGSTDGAMSDSATGGGGIGGSRIIGVAGVMGGADTEIRETTTEIVLEAAHFDPVAVSRTGRRLGLASEAARRFERGVDPLVPPVAAARAAALLVELGGARVTGLTDVGSPALPATFTMRADHPDRVAGLTYGGTVVTKRLHDVGCAVREESAEPAVLVVTPPSWRPDLLEPNDLAEEVIRLEGYENLPSVLPRTLAGSGLTARQRLRRRLGRALAAAGYVEVLPSPFVGAGVLDALGLDRDDPRRRLVRLANPLSEEEPYLRPTLLPDLLTTLRRNVGRGFADVALFESGKVFRAPDRAADTSVPRPGIGVRPSDADLASIDAALPAQPEHVAVVLAGDRRPQGWWGSGEPVTWADAVEAARTVAAAAGVTVTTRHAAVAPWHPGRCAELAVGGAVVGYAGELHPRVLEALDLPARTCAMELDLEALAPAVDVPTPAPTISTYPVATQDLAVVVSEAVPVATVEAALRTGAGDLLEDIALFDVYTGDQVPPGARSLAYHLRLRAPDRTLTAEEASAVRRAALDEAARTTGAILRSSP